LGTKVTFDDQLNVNRVLNGQYPSGVIDWGTNRWYLSAPWGVFTTQSISFNGSSSKSAAFTLLGARQLLSLDTYNGGSGASTVTLSCNNLPTITTTVPSRQLVTVNTNWSGTCASVTIGSSNGWNTNFDNLLIQ